MNMKTSLRTAILSFAFTGVFGPHKTRFQYEPDRPQSPSNGAQPRPH